MPYRKKERRKMCKTFFYTAIFIFFPSPSSSKMWKTDIPSCQIAGHSITEIIASLDTWIINYFLYLFLEALKIQIFLDRLLIGTIFSLESIAFSRPPGFSHFLAKSKRTFVWNLVNTICFLDLCFCRFSLKNRVKVDVEVAMLKSLFRPKAMTFRSF